MEEFQIKRHQDFLSEMYGQSNQGKSYDYIYGYLSRSVSYLGKSLASKSNNDTHFLRSISWLFALASKFDIDVQEKFFSRFPGVCPYCLEDSCVCFKTHKQPLKSIPAYKASEELEAKVAVYFRFQRDFSLDSAGNLISSVFPANEIIWHHAGPWFLLSKLQEEVGEVHEAMSKLIAQEKSIASLEEEISDVLAWIVSAWNIAVPDRKLDEAFKDYYMKGCPVCNEKICSCEDRAERPDQLIDQKKLVEVSEKLKDLSQMLPDCKVLLDDLIKSTQVAINTQSEPDSAHLVKEADNTLSKIKDSLSHADEAGKSALGIIESIQKIIRVFGDVVLSGGGS